MAVQNDNKVSFDAASLAAAASAEPQGAAAPSAAAPINAMAAAPLDGLQAQATAQAMGASANAADQAPVLPNAAEEPASAGASARFVAGINNLTDMQAFAIIQEGQRKALTLAANMRRAAQKSVISEGLNAALDLIRQVAGERQGSVYKLMGDIGGATIGFGAGAKGTQLRMNGDDGQRTLGAGLDVAAQQLGSAFSSGVSMLDKLGGNGTYQADQARIDQKMDEVRKSIAQQVLDSARGIYDQADKALQNAMQAFADYFKRKEGLMSSIANQNP